MGSKHVGRVGICWHCPAEPDEECRKKSCTSKADMGWPQSYQPSCSGMIKREHCRRLKLMKCEQGTCGQFNICQHGHGTVRVNAVGHGENMVVDVGRGCCETCGSKPVTLPYKRPRTVKESRND